MKRVGFIWLYMYKKINLFLAEQSFWKIRKAPQLLVSSICRKVFFQSTKRIWILTLVAANRADHARLYNVASRLTCTVRKMGLILRSIERMLKMQFSMARNFTRQPLRRYDVKPPEKTAQA
jgi:hypothetical protein